MLQKLKQFAYSCLLLTIILVLSLIKTEEITPSFLFGIEHMDKVVHMLMYFGLTLTLLTENSLCRHQNSIKKITFLFYAIALGGMMELSQKFLTSYRSADIIDMAANITGATSAFLLFTAAEKKITTNPLVTGVIKIRNWVTNL